MRQRPTWLRQIFVVSHENLHHPRPHRQRPHGPLGAPMTRHGIFISSVQKEFAAERLALRDFLQGDPLLRRFFEPVLFEDLPASDRRADDLYLGLVDRCELYVGLFGSEYGSVDSEGLSPT